MKTIRHLNRVTFGCCLILAASFLVSDEFGNLFNLESGNVRSSELILFSPDVNRVASGAFSKEKLKIIGTYEWKHGAEPLGFEEGQLELLPDGTARFSVGEAKFPDARWTKKKDGEIMLESRNGTTEVYRVNSNRSITGIAVIRNGERSSIPKSEKKTHKKRD